MVDRLAVFRQLLGVVRPHDVAIPRLVDLGAGHGKFARVAAEDGWTVLAVDARTERMIDVPGVTWVERDVRDFAIPEADCLALLGLLYHLTLEDQMEVLARCVGVPTIIDTHVALEVSHHEGEYGGYLFWEDLEQPTAAVGNTHSFWPTISSLVAMMHDVGFGNVLVREPWYEENRTFLLCL